MATFSCLRKSIWTLRDINKISSFLPKISNSQICIRQMSGGHHQTMRVTPSSYDWRQWKDEMLFYVALAAIPLGLVVFLTNVFIGPAELAEIPEGYRPKVWEYYKHPITRTLAWLSMEPIEKTHEVNMHYMYLEDQKIRIRKLEERVKEVMKQRGDYRGWYYIPIHDRSVLVGRQVAEEENFRGKYVSK